MCLLFGIAIAIIGTKLIVSILDLDKMTETIYWVQENIFLKQTKPVLLKFTREFTQEEQAKLYLYELIIEKELTYRDFRILREIIECESKDRKSVV